jgi:RNA polymerase sigma-70 factor (ECF subfamily)
MRWSEASDAALLAASRLHPDAFMVFYERYEAAVIGYLLRRTRDTELAVDLASEAFATALAAGDRYRPDRDSAAAWLFTIAQNILTDSVRRGRVEALARRRLGIRDAIAYTDDELERIEATVSQPDWAERLLERLPSDQRDAVRARVIDEQPYGEIAQAMRTSELVVRQRVSRGLAALREHIEQERP